MQHRCIRFLIALGLGAMLALPVLAEGGGGKKKGRPGGKQVNEGDEQRRAMALILRLFDQNHDGKLSPEERRAMLAQFDRNQDGSVSPQEAQQTVAELMEGPKEGRKEGPKEARKERHKEARKKEGEKKRKQDGEAKRKKEK